MRGCWLQDRQVCITFNLCESCFLADFLFLSNKYSDTDTYKVHCNFAITDHLHGMLILSIGLTLILIIFNFHIRINLFMTICIRLYHLLLTIHSFALSFHFYSSMMAVLTDSPNHKLKRDIPLLPKNQPSSCHAMARRHAVIKCIRNRIQ